MGEMAIAMTFAGTSTLLVLVCLLQRIGRLERIVARHDRLMTRLVRQNVDS
jgi:hypothetical protein